MPCPIKLIHKYSNKLKLPSRTILRTDAARPGYYYCRTRESHIIRIPSKGWYDAHICLHEVGHFFLHVHYRSAVPAGTFRKIFGPREVGSTGRARLARKLLHTTRLRAGFVSSYAQVSPEEDWAETFSVALQAVEEDHELDLEDDTTLSLKLEFVFSCLQRVNRILSSRVIG